MEILQLKYFCDAAETQNFSKTAKKFGVPPSNISQCIKRLETELEVSLFSRKSNRLFLNEQGRAFYEKVSKALNLLDEAKAEAEDKNHRGKIKICIISNRRVVMKAIEKFRRLFPQVVFILSHEFDETEDYDLVITDDLFDAADMEKRPIISEDFSLAMKRDNPLAKKEKIEIDDLRNENFVNMSRKSSLFTTTQQFCKSCGFEPNVVIQSEDPFYMRKCVELGLGIAFVPVISWKGLFSEEVVLKPVDGFRRNTCAYWSKKRFMSRVTNDFLEMLISECENEK